MVVAGKRKPVKAFRADKRLFKVDDRIRTAGQYAVLFSPDRRAFEQLVEDKRPTAMPPRSSCLFVFKDRAPGEKYWSKMTGGKLYEVEFDEGAVIHRGDMQLLEHAFEAGAGSPGSLGLIDLYWLGAMSSSPEVEILVPHATVTVVISTDDRERLRHLKARIGSSLP